MCQNIKIIVVIRLYLYIKKIHFQLPNESHFFFSHSSRRMQIIKCQLQSLLSHVQEHWRHINGMFNSKRTLRCLPLIQRHPLGAMRARPRLISRVTRHRVTSKHTIMRLSMPVSIRHHYGVLARTGCLNSSKNFKQKKNKVVFFKIN